MTKRTVRRKVVKRKPAAKRATRRKKVVRKPVRKKTVKRSVKRKPVKKRAVKRKVLHKKPPQKRRARGYIPFDVLVDKLQHSKKKQSVLDVTDYSKAVKTVKMKESKDYIPVSQLAKRFEKKRTPESYRKEIKKKMRKGLLHRIKDKVKRKKPVKRRVVKKKKTVSKRKSVKGKVTKKKPRKKR